MCAAATDQYENGNVVMSANFDITALIVYESSSFFSTVRLCTFASSAIRTASGAFRLMLRGRSCRWVG